MTSQELRLGASGDVILQLTTTLSRLGFIDQPASKFDEGVEAAVKAFQQERGLTVNGIIDSITHRNLEEARCVLRHAHRHRLRQQRCARLSGLSGR